MKRLLIISLLLLSLSGCFNGHDEEKRREMTQWQVRVVQTELQGIGQSHQRLNTDLAMLQARLNDMGDELGRGDARLFAIGASNKYLLELHTQGFGPSAGRWVLENPAWPSKYLFLFALVVVLCWAVYRMRLRGLEAADLAEVRRVIDQINRPDPVSISAALLAPADPPPPPASRPPKPATPPAPQPAPVAAPAVKAKAPAAEAKAPAPAPAAPAAESTAVKPAEKKPESAPVKKTVSRRDARRKVAARSAAKKCKVEGCPNKHRSKGYCNKHYQQWRKSGSPEGDDNE